MEILRTGLPELSKPKKSESNRSKTSKVEIPNLKKIRKCPRVFAVEPKIFELTRPRFLAPQNVRVNPTRVLAPQNFRVNPTRVFGTPFFSS